MIGMAEAEFEVRPIVQIAALPYFPTTHEGNEIHRKMVKTSIRGQH